jgi:hypothetical protein
VDENGDDARQDLVGSDGDAGGVTVASKDNNKI